MDNWEKVKELARCKNLSHFSNRSFDSAQPEKGFDLLLDKELGFSESDKNLDC